MPQIGTLGTKKRISQDVGRTPTVNLDQAGRVGRAIQGLGGAVGKVGKDIARHEGQKNRIQALDYKKKSMNEINDAVLKFSNSEKLNIQGSNPEGFAARSASNLDAIKKEVYSRAPSSDAKQELEKVLEPYSVTTNLKNKGFEDRESLQYYNKNLLDNQTSTASRLEANSSMLEANVAMAGEEVNLAERLQAGQINKATYGSLLGRANKLYGASYLAGKQRNGLSEVEDVIGTENKMAVVNAQLDDKNSGLMKNMDPAIKEKYRATFKRMVDSQAASQDRVTIQLLGDTRKVYASGEVKSPAVLERLQDSEENLNMLNDEELRDRQIGLMEDAKRVQGDMNVISMASVSELMSMKSQTLTPMDEGEDALGAVESIGYKRQLGAAIDQAIQRRYKSPYEETIKNRPDLEGNPAAILDYQVSQGYPNLAVMDKRMATIHAKGMMEGNAEQKAAAMDKYLATMPDSRSRGVALNQLTRFGGLPKEYKAAAYFDNGNVRELILRNATNGKEIGDTFKKNPVNTQKSVDLALSKKFEKITQIFSRAGADSVLTSLYGAVEAETKNLINTGKEDNINKAGEAAFKKIISDNFVIGSLSGSPILVPNNMNLTNETINKFDSYTKSIDYLKSLNLDKTRTGSTLSDEDWYKGLSENTKWQQNNEGTGIVLMVNGVHGYGPQVDANNAKIEVMFEDMQDTVNKAKAGYEKQIEADILKPQKLPSILKE